MTLPLSWPQARPRRALAATALGDAAAHRSSLAPDAAESIFGVDFTEAEEQMALQQRQSQPRQLRPAAQAQHPARHRAGDHVPAVSARARNPPASATPGAKLKFDAAGRAGEPHAGARSRSCRSRRSRR